MSSTGKYRLEDGDWICPDLQCKNVNFAKRISCNRCGKEKTEVPSRKVLGQEIGKVAAEKSRGLFSAEDWLCGRCGNVNWARRTQCNMCNAPRFGELEERTGLGGGYNERENVEYVNRSESDSEYDDFGRKKKKKLRKQDSPKKNDRVPKQEKKVSEDEEEEEGDVSKYKLDSGDEQDSPAAARAVDNDEEEEEEEEDVDLSKYDLSGWGGDDSSSDEVEQRKRKRSRSR